MGGIGETSKNLESSQRHAGSLIIGVSGQLIQPLRGLISAPKSDFEPPSTPSQHGKGLRMHESTTYGLQHMKGTSQRAG